MGRQKVTGHGVRFPGGRGRCWGRSTRCRMVEACRSVGRTHELSCPVVCSCHAPRVGRAPQGNQPQPRQSHIRRSIRPKARLTGLGSGGCSRVRCAHFGAEAHRNFVGASTLARHRRAALNAAQRECCVRCGPWIAASDIGATPSPGQLRPAAIHCQSYGPSPCVPPCRNAHNAGQPPAARPAHGPTATLNWMASLTSLGRSRRV